MKIISDTGKEYQVEKYLSPVRLNICNSIGIIEELTGMIVPNVNGFVYFFYQKYTDMYELDYEILENWKIVDE